MIKLAPKETMYLLLLDFLDTICWVTWRSGNQTQEVITLDDNLQSIIFVNLQEPSKCVALGDKECEFFVKDLLFCGRANEYQRNLYKQASVLAQYPDYIV